MSVLVQVLKAHQHISSQAVHGRPLRHLLAGQRQEESVSSIPIIVEVAGLPES